MAKPKKLKKTKKKAKKKSSRSGHPPYLPTPEQIAEETALIRAERLDTSLPPTRIQGIPNKPRDPKVTHRVHIGTSGIDY